MIAQVAAALVNGKNLHAQTGILHLHASVGTLLWIASWRDVTIIGLPSCGLGPRLTAFDLVLPKLLAEG